MTIFKILPWTLSVLIVLSLLGLGLDLYDLFLKPEEIELRQIQSVALTLLILFGIVRAFKAVYLLVLALVAIGTAMSFISAYEIYGMRTDLEQRLAIALNEEKPKDYKLSKHEIDLYRSAGIGSLQFVMLVLPTTVGYFYRREDDA